MSCVFHLRCPWLRQLWQVLYIPDESATAQAAEATATEDSGGGGGGTNRQLSQLLNHHPVAPDSEVPIPSQQVGKLSGTWSPSGIGEVSEDHIRVPARFMSSAHVRKWRREI